MSRKTPKHNHKSIKMTQKDSLFNCTELGDFYWSKDSQDRECLFINIPDLDSDKGFVLTRWTIGYKNHCGAQWLFSGEKNLPTLTPSLHAVGTWHGWVRSGELIEA